MTVNLETLPIYRFKARYIGDWWLLGCDEVQAYAQSHNYGAALDALRASISRALDVDRDSFCMASDLETVDQPKPTHDDVSDALTDMVFAMNRSINLRGGNRVPWEDLALDKANRALGW